jgi:hypothetical protein
MKIAIEVRILGGVGIDAREGIPTDLDRSERRKTISHRMLMNSGHFMNVLAKRRRQK